MRKYLALFTSLVLGMVVFTGISVAQEEGKLDEYGVTFPITELGSCEDFASCRSYCDDPVNATTCVDYAKEKGFYDEEELEDNKTSALQNSKRELGCDGEASCRNLCEQPANYQKCSRFATRYSLGGGVVENPGGTVVLNRAREVLGCTSVNSCKEYCEDESHRSECSNFAREAGLRGGELRVGPGGCTSEGSCQAFCAAPSNFGLCQGFTASVGGEFSGPGGCNSEETCRTFCERNPSSCRDFGEREEIYNPVDMCNRTSSCYWGNNACNCNSSYNPGNEDPSAQCVKYSGCTWSGNACQCNTPTYTPYPGSGEGGYEGNMMSQEQQQAACTSCGGTCTWNGDACGCQCATSGSSGGSTATSTPSTPAPSTPAPTTSNYVDPASACTSAGGTWNGSSCTMNPVQGASSGTSFWEWFFGLFE